MLFEIERGALQDNRYARVSTGESAAAQMKQLRDAGAETFSARRPAEPRPTASSSAAPWRGSPTAAFWFSNKARRS
jgi:hypothetical protein